MPGWTNLVNELYCRQATLYTWRFLRSVLRSRVIDLRKTVHAGGPAYDADVVGVDGVTRRLLDFERGSRPLVLVFGSCT